MKLFKRLAVIILTAYMFMPNFLINAELNVKAVEFYDNSVMKNQAEELYKKINDFLLEYGNVSQEEFDDVCKDYMTKDFESTNLLDKRVFEEKSQGNTILYRGLSETNFAGDFKKGIIYCSSNTKNVRGMGIYTTTSLECAKRYSNENDLETVIKMFIPKTGVKILENEYLEKLKEMICSIHSEEFGEFSNGNKESYIFDSMSEYLNGQFSKVFEKIEKEKIESSDEQQRLLDEVVEQLKNDPVCQELKANRKRYFKNNKASIFYNSGLLTKLLGFDILHSIDYLSDTVGYKEEEYLVINSKIINILSD